MIVRRRLVSIITLECPQELTCSGRELVATKITAESTRRRHAVRNAVGLMAVIMLFAIACGGVGESGAGPTAGLTDQPPPGAEDVNIRDLVLRPEDVPPELGTLGEPMILTAEEMFAEGLEAGEVTQQDIAASDLVGGAFQVYNGPARYPDQGVSFMVISVQVLGSVDGAGTFYAAAESGQNQRQVEEYEAFPGRDVFEYEELGELSIGDQSEMIRYVSQDPDDQVRLEHYWLVFRRDRVTASFQVRAPEGNVTLDQVTELAEKLDGRIQDGLR